MMKKAFILWSVTLLSACSLTPKSPVDLVDPFIGTGFHGHTYPGATVPFGGVQLSPDTRRGNWDACSGYHYTDSTMMGFSHTHLSGTGCIDLGDILFRPFSTLETGFSHEDETASPGYYSVLLKNAGVKAELTATTHTGIHRYTWSPGTEPVLEIDLSHLLDNESINKYELKQTGPDEITGMRSTDGWVTNQTVYFVARFSSPIKNTKIKHYPAMTLYFDMPEGTPLIVKAGLSINNEESARRNLIAETADSFDFDHFKDNARSDWEKHLDRIQIEGGTKAERINFYTALYHSQVVPNTISDADTTSRLFSTFSTWDTFRAWHPMMTLLDTALVDEMVNSLLYLYDIHGELPLWPLSTGETGTMIGYHSTSIIADAYLKGIRGFDAEKAFKAMKISAAKNKKGAAEYIAQGFIPANQKKESVSCLLEFAYDDWCIAQMAKAMNKTADYETFIQRSQNFINVFDGTTGFFRGKRQDGNWEAPFNPFAIGRSYTEATAWQYRFFVPHDVYGLEQLMGGRDRFITNLDSLFTVTSEVEGELSDVTGLIGQYAHGNEPSHHMAYLYSYVGEPWKTQYWTRRLLDEMYQPTPEGIIGNEDCGQMSAWYILSSLGFYPVCPGSNQFVLTAPLFEKATMQLANGKTLEITANNPAKNKYITKVSLNKQEIPECFITYDQLMEGGTLAFTLSAEPDTIWGTGKEAAPYSYTTTPVVSVPSIATDLYLFEGKATVALVCATPEAIIHYTLDGTEPTEDSPVYASPFTLIESAVVKAKAYKKGYTSSRTYAIRATKAKLRPGKAVAPHANGIAYQYFEGYFQLTADLKQAKIAEQGIMPEPSITEAKQADHFGYIFTGYLLVPENGVYEFFTRSDDGSVLFIDGEEVVNNDTSHAAIVSSGRIPLQKGYHAFRLEYFEDYEGEHLSWGWKKPGDTEFVPIPRENLFH